MRCLLQHQGFPIILVLFTLTLFSCTEKDPIHLGFVAGLSGRVSDLGIAGRNGVTLAVEEQNRKGTVKGRKIKLVTVDDKQNPDTAAEAVETLIAGHVEAIIGPMTSSMAVEMVPRVNLEKIIMVSPTANTEDLVGLDDYFFRVISSTSYYADHLAKYVRDEMGLKYFSVVYDLNNRAFTESFHSGFSSSLHQYGGKITRTKTFYSGSDASFFDLTQDAVGPETQGLLILASALDTALICQQIKKISPDLVIVGTGWSATEKLIELGGTAVENIYLQQYMDRDSKAPRYIAFRNAYIERFGEAPGFASVAGYDAANMIIEAFRKTPLGESLKQTIIKTAEFEGIQQPINIDRFGDATRIPYLSTVRNGKYVVLQ